MPQDYVVLLGMFRRLSLLPQLSRDAWLVLVGDTLSAVGTGLTLPLLLVYLHRVRGIDLEVAGLVLATFALASFLGNPIGGHLADRLGSRITLILGLVIAAIGAGAFALVTHAWEGFAVAGIAGFGIAVTWPAQNALLATVVLPEQRSSVFAMQNATLNAGLGTGALIASAMADLSSPSSFVPLYLLDAASYLAAIPLILAVRAGAAPKVTAVEHRMEGSYREVIADKVFVRVWVLTALLVAIGYGQQNSSYPAYATGRGGISARALSLTFTANTLTIVLAQLFVLRLLTGKRRTRAIAMVCACWAIAWAIIMFAGGPRWLAVTLFIAAMMVFGLGETLFSPTIPGIVNDLAPDHLRGRYNGLSTLAFTMGFSVGPAVAGFALGAGMDKLFFAGLIAACGVAAAGALRLERHLPAEANYVGAAPIPKKKAAVEVGTVAEIAEPAASEIEG